MVRMIDVGSTYTLRPGDHFDVMLPDGTILNVEQTADDFSIARQDGTVAYTTPTSPFAKDQESDVLSVTGRK